MQNIIYTKYYMDRDDKYKVQTDIIVNNDGTKVVRKKPYSSKSQGHILQVNEGCCKFKEAYSDIDVQINDCLFDGKSICFAYIDGQSLEEVLDKALAQNDVEQAFNYLKKYCDIVRHHTHHLFKKNDKFVKIFGDFDFEDGTEVVSIGDIGLNFSNIIIKDDWYINNSEWIFDFDIPVDYIIYQSLEDFFDVMSGHEYRKLLMDNNVFDVLKIDASLIDTFKNMNNNFNAYIRGVALTGGELQSLVGKDTIEVKDIINIQEQNKRKKIIQIFYDFGEGFSEKNSQCMLPAGEDENIVDIEIIIPKNCVMLRIDPMNDFGMFELEKIVLDGQSVDFNVNGINIDGIIVFDNDDPQIVVQNVCEYKKFVLKGKVGGSVALVKQFQILAQKNRALEEELQQIKNLKLSKNKHFWSKK